MGQRVSHAHHNRDPSAESFLQAHHNRGVSRVHQSRGLQPGGALEALRLRTLPAPEDDKAGDVVGDRRRLLRAQRVRDPPLEQGGPGAGVLQLVGSGGILRVGAGACDDGSGVPACVGLRGREGGEAAQRRVGMDVDAVPALPGVREDAGVSRILVGFL